MQRAAFRFSIARLQAYRCLCNLLNAPEKQVTYTVKSGGGSR